MSQEDVWLKILQFVEYKGGAVHELAGGRMFDEFRTWAGIIAPGSYTTIPGAMAADGYLRRDGDMWIRTDKQWCGKPTDMSLTKLISEMEEFDYPASSRIKAWTSNRRKNMDLLGDQNALRMDALGHQPNGVNGIKDVGILQASHGIDASLLGLGCRQGDALMLTGDMNRAHGCVTLPEQCDLVVEPMDDLGWFSISVDDKVSIEGKTYLAHGEMFEVEGSLPYLQHLAENFRLREVIKSRYTECARRLRERDASEWRAKNQCLV